MALVAAFPQPIPQRNAVREPVSDEARLLAAIRGGDRDAAEEMVDRTYAAVFASLCRLCGDKDLASDLTQETYRKAWEALPRFDGRSQLFTWLYRIAYTTFLNHLRRPRPISSIDEPDAPEMADLAPAVDVILGDEEEAALLRNAVLRLPDDLRFTVTAHFWGGLSVKDLSEIEGITTVAIRKRLHKAFTLLESTLGLTLDKDTR